jgi:hypothetical protein
MDSSLVQIFASEATPRLKYIAGIMLGDILGLSWEIVTEKPESGNNPVINYSSEDIPGSYRVPVHGILSEKGITERKIGSGIWKSLPVIFTMDESADMPFDIFAASFYLVSRYEEYLPSVPDEHGRFRASSSIAFKNNFLGIPVADMWTIELGKELQSGFPGMIFHHSKFTSLLTVDTDQPFEYLGKSAIRSLGGITRDLFTGSVRVSERFRVLARKSKDRYFVYDYICEAVRRNNTESLFFFLLGNHSKNDPNPEWTSRDYRELINSIASVYGTGIHPSYNSFLKYERLKKEIRRLQIISKKVVTRSRFHFIRYSMPQSYRDLINAGISEDYSMGYPEEPGFRAGISRPFYFYDVEADLQTNLVIFPFMVMDVTLSRYKGLDPEASAEILEGLIDRVRIAGGKFVSLWHNTSLSDMSGCKGWRELFESMLKMQKQ